MTRFILKIINIVLRNMVNLWFSRNLARIWWSTSYKVHLHCTTRGFDSFWEILMIDLGFYENGCLFPPIIRNNDSLGLVSLDYDLYRH